MTKQNQEPVISLNDKEMKVSDYDELLSLWQSVSGLLLPAKEEPKNLERFLERNPGLSYVLKYEEKIIGAILCGHDGLQGYIHRAAVSPLFQGGGYGSMLVEQCRKSLAEIGIDRVRITVSEENALGQAFWEKKGWKEHGESKLMSLN